MKKNKIKSKIVKSPDVKKLKILEVNNIDILGRRFNGYDLQIEINNNTRHSAKQIVNEKMSREENVIEFHKNEKLYSKEFKLIKAESEILSVHSQLSLTSNILKNKEEFKKADLVHYHLIHNTKLSLVDMIELCSNKPSIITIHDSWNFTGRCVQPQECEKWKIGCKKCEHLDTLFPFNEDNCNSLWNLKKYVYDNIDVDVIVSTPFMKKMLDESPICNNLKNVHIIPFGIDLNKFKSLKSRKKLRKNYNIKDDEIVLFFRSQMAMKGTEYIIEALKMLNTNKRITLLTCGEKGILKELKEKYKIIELGNISDENLMITAYNMCDIFLMPSKGESFGLMAVEAMACSKPVIIFDNTSLPYVTFAPKCGVLVENKNSKKLMGAIKMLIENPKEREKRGNLGRKLAEENYDLKRYNKKIIETYEKAYERQKNKSFKNNFKIEINKNNLDVQNLIPKLKKIYKIVFEKSKFPKSISKLKKNIDVNSKRKINYCSKDVINLIKLFNNEIYKSYLIYGKFIESNKLKKFLYYLKYDKRSLYIKFKYDIKKILKKKQIL